MNPPPRPRIPLAAGLAFAVALLFSPLRGNAAVIGEPITLSAIGSPLRIELGATGALAGAGECLVLAAGPSDDGLPWVRDARITVTGRGDAARIVVTGRTPIFEPVVRLGIEDVCDTRLRREYTLLLPFPDLSAPVAESPATGAAVREAIQPPPAPPGTIPRRATGNGSPPPRAARTAKTSEVAARPAPAPATGEPPAPPKDRLMLGGEVRSEDGLRLSTELASFDRIRHTTDAERDRLRREQNVVMAIDRTIVAQLEMNERIRQLEQIQAAMLERARNLGAARADGVTPPPAKSTSAVRDWLVPALALAALSALLAAALHRLRRRRMDAGGEAVEPALGEPIYRAPVGAAGTESVATAAPTPTAGPSKDLAADEAAGEPLAPVERAPMQWQAPAETAAAVLRDEEEAEEHESAIELAEIMMGFGRVQGAAETLVEFINSNPKKAVTPWLKLLEVYRAGGYRMEFDALARQLNKTFNVKSVTWDTFDEARKASNTIEQMAHVIANVQRMWGSRECQAYLEKLLRDNRDGTREGFPLSVIDEILMLAGVLDEQLGVYRPDEPGCVTPAA